MIRFMFHVHLFQTEFGAFLRQLFFAQRVVDRFRRGAVFVFLVETFKIHEDRAVVRTPRVIENTDDLKGFVKIVVATTAIVTKPNLVPNL